MNLNVIAAAVIGGTSLSGDRHGHRLHYDGGLVASSLRLLSALDLRQEEGAFLSLALLYADDARHPI